jgi:hypothetical protein
MKRFTPKTHELALLDKFGSQSGQGSEACLVDLLALIDSKGFSESVEAIRAIGTIKRKSTRQGQYRELQDHLAIYLSARFEAKHLEDLASLSGFEWRKLRTIGQKLEKETGYNEVGKATLIRYIETTPFLKHIDPESVDVERLLLEAFQKESLIEVD